MINKIVMINFRLMLTGYKRILEQEDVWDLEENYKTKEIVNRFQKEWEKEVERVKRLVGVVKANKRQ